MPALQVGFALAILTLFLRNRVMDVLGGVTTEELNYLLLAIGISLAEETIFRGYIQMRLSWWLGKWPGIVLTAAMFALWHVPAWLNRVPVETGLLLTGLTLVHGLVLGWIMSVSKNVIAPALYRSISIWMYVLG
jgi:membrane protease YdiL (CAAX protease family)